VFAERVPFRLRKGLCLHIVNKNLFPLPRYSVAYPKAMSDEETGPSPIAVIAIISGLLCCCCICFRTPLYNFWIENSRGPPERTVKDVFEEQDAANDATDQTYEWLKDIFTRQELYDALKALKTIRGVFSKYMNNGHLDYNSDFVDDFVDYLRNRTQVQKKSPGKSIERALRELYKKYEQTQSTAAASCSAPPLFL